MHEFPGSTDDRASTGSVHSEVPEHGNPPKSVAINRNPADGRERQVCGDQLLAGCRQFPQKPNANASRLLGIVFEAVVSVRMLEPDREHGIAGECQPIAAG